MAVEIPYDLITELQISLRKEAGLSCYDPNDTSLPDLPSVEDAISELDPSPAYLRCKQCKGRLLRGINSIFCVFCGRQQNKDVPPQPIKFMSTFGCRWFLRSLDLDGSELVGRSVDANESNRGQSTQQNEFPLSDLLDLEIRWPSESEKLETSVTNKTAAQKLSTLNLAGVDLDNFFAESKVDSISAQFEGQFASSKQDDAMGSSAFRSHGNLSLFENVLPSEVVARSKGDESDDPSSGWEAQFQSAGSGTQCQEPELFDPFVGSSTVALSAHIDSVFEPGKDLFDGKTKENTTTSTSSTNDCFKGGLSSNSNSGLTAQDEQFKLPINDQAGETVGNANNYSPMNIDWIQDNQWQTTSSSKSPDNKTVDEDDDSFDAWNDFTSSTNVQVPSNNSSTQGVNHMVPSVEQASEINLLGGSNNLQDVDFDSFSQPGFFSETLNNQNGSTEVNFMQSEPSVSDRMAGTDGGDRRSAGEIEKVLDVSNANTRSQADDVEVLMSQMHDLSFMLESNLSLPD